MSPAKLDVGLYDLTRSELADLLDSQPSYRIDQLWDGLYRQQMPLSELTNLPKQLRTDLGELAGNRLQLVQSVPADKGRTTKQLWSLADGQLVESVVMRYYNRTTLCVSSQAGCAMGCTFCATGQIGFARHLSVGEIVEQVLRSNEAQRGDAGAQHGGAGAARGNTGSQPASTQDSVNVVFMGMGEPLANFDAVWEAVERLNTDVGIGARRITISTVGIVPGIKRLAETDLPVNLAVSLHAANDKLRNQLVPINQQYPLAELARTLQHYRRAKRRRISFEWVMIDNVNDSYRHAQELAEYCRPLAAHVNLIPLNATPGYEMSPSPRSVIEAFADDLTSAGVNTTIRDNRGTDIDAACGQLRASAQTNAVTLKPARRQA